MRNSLAAAHHFLNSITVDWWRKGKISTFSFLGPGAYLTQCEIFLGRGKPPVRILLRRYFRRNVRRRLKDSERFFRQTSSVAAPGS
jgi:hypothetical protein